MQYCIINNDIALLMHYRALLQMPGCNLVCLSSQVGITILRYLLFFNTGLFLKEQRFMMKKKNANVLYCK